MRGQIRLVGLLLFLNWLLSFQLRLGSGGANAQVRNFCLAQPFMKCGNIFWVRSSLIQLDHLSDSVGVCFDEVQVAEFTFFFINSL